MAAKLKMHSAILAGALLAVTLSWCRGAYIEGGEERTPPTPLPRPIVGPERPHVSELESYLGRIAEIRNSLAYRYLAVFPVVLKGDEELTGPWLGAHEAMSRRVLVAKEVSGGSVPDIVVENRGKESHVLILTGEVIAGGKQTRTMREDAIVAPRQKVRLGVYCVEHGRWTGSDEFKSGNMLAPQSMQREMRSGTTQERVWEGVSKANRTLGSENATDSLETGQKSEHVRKALDEVRKAIVPGIPKESVGFIFVHRGRAVGAEFFGNSHLAMEYLPKLLDSYAVEFVLRDGAKDNPDRQTWEPYSATRYLEQIKHAGSERCATPGSGAGIRTRWGGLTGAGVSLGGKLVHYGVQPAGEVAPTPLYKRSID